MKILFVATVRSHIGQFHMPFINELKRLGATVDAAYKDNSADKPGLDLSAIDTVYEVPFSRSPYSTQNIKAYFELKKIIENGGYDAVHCHTPMGSVVTRLAAKNARKKGLRVIYTAHGFHFYNGASKKNWLLFYPVEKYLSKFTDCLILINNEDCQLAKSKGFKAGKIEKVNGVGVDVDKFHIADDNEKKQLRSQFGYSDSDFLIIYPADFCDRKNQKMLFDAVKILLEKHGNIRLLLPGLDEYAQPFIEYAKEIGIFDNIDILGYRRDIEKLVAMCDVSVSVSKQEGLPINLIEAMAIGNSIVATDVRGNNDLVEDGKNGYLVKLNDSVALAERIDRIYNDLNLRERFKEYNKQKVRQYSLESVISDMLNIYKDLSLL